MPLLYLPLLLAGGVLLDRILFDDLETRFGMAKLHATMPGYRETIFPRIFMSLTGLVAIFFVPPEHASWPFVVVIGGPGIGI